MLLYLGGCLDLTVPGRVPGIVTVSWRVPGFNCTWEGAWMLLYLEWFLEVAVPRRVSGCNCTWDCALMLLYLGGCLGVPVPRRGELSFSGKHIAQSSL